MKVRKHSCVSVRWNELYVFVPGLVSVHVELRHQRRSPPGPFFVTRFEVDSPVRFLKNLIKDREVK